MTGWKEFRLDELGEILNSHRVPLSSLVRAKRQGKYPYYGASGIVDYIDDYIFDGEHLLISEDGENLVSRSTPIAFIADGQFWVNNHAHIFKGHAPYMNGLAKHYILASDLNEYITGAAQPKLSKAALLSIPFFLPINEAEQEALSAVLSSLDGKIDLLHRQNATLRAMAEALFHQLFVVETKDEWEEKPLLHYIKLIGGGTPKTYVKEYWNGAIPWLSGGDIANAHKSFALQSVKTITEVGIDKSSAKLLPKFSTLLTARGTVGKYCLLGRPMAYSQTNYGILPVDNHSYFFTFLLIDHVVKELQMAAYGSVFDTITTQTFDNVKISLPSQDLIRRFDTKICVIFFKIFANQTQICTLQKLRDTLLPKLMSGEVRVEF